jgi:hypothetical protein
VNRPLREGLGLLAAFVMSLACVIAITWPMVNYLDEVVPGGGELGGWLWRYQWHFDELGALAYSDAGLVDRWLAFVSLGRYPETGNILDVLALSYPLEHLLGFPGSYNAKIAVVLVLDGVAGYALARYFSGSIAAALAAASIAVVNPLTVLEIGECGLRQAVLWWVLLYPALLDRALRRRTFGAGVLAGVCFGFAGAWYWFYGLFTGIFTLLWVVKTLVAERQRLRLASMFRSLLGVALGIALSAGPFVVAYLLGDGTGGGGSGRAALPEMSFFLPFPSYDTVSHAPLRPETYAENVLASINRTIGSSWSATYPIDPRVGFAMPLTVMAFGVLPALARRRSWGWLAVWFFFYLGTLGPFLRIGDGDAREVFRLEGGYVIRMPYTLMFQYIPGMSRMFAPYRLASYLVVASVALVAMGLARLPFRAWIAPAVIVATVAQPLYYWGRGSVVEGGGDAREWRSPIKTSRIRVPQYYRDLDSTQLTGIVELPLEHQQDLLYYYQVIHHQKVYRSWASPGAVPPFLRAKGAGGPVGERLRYLARPDVVAGKVPRVWEELSEHPMAAAADDLSVESFRKWGRSGNYQRVIVHERGYFLTDRSLGARFYTAAVERLTERLGIEPQVFTELQKGDPRNPEFGVPTSGDLVPWTSQPADIPEAIAPSSFRMAVFEIGPDDGAPASEASPAEAATSSEAQPVPPDPAPTGNPEG